MNTEEVAETIDTNPLGTETSREYMDTELTKSARRPVSQLSKAAFAFLFLVAVVAAVGWYLHAQIYESTDDAQIDGHINAVGSRVAGTVKQVYVDDNQTVQAGQPLIDLDTRELTITEEQMAAQYAQAVARLRSEDPGIAITQNTNVADITLAQTQVADARAALSASQDDRQNAASRLAEAQATAKRDQLQSDRYQQLFKKDETSRQELEGYIATAQASAARLAAADAALASAESTVQQRRVQVDAKVAHLSEVAKDAPFQLAVRKADAESQEAGVELAGAESDHAKLDLSFAHIVAPISGVVTQRSAEPGNHIAPGEQLLMLVDVSHLWVTANFKETQLSRMHSGCRAVVHVDALDRSFDGTVESMPAITGARASILPPENATGNYVKVIQRLPVRIRLRDGQSGLAKLRPGMSVEAQVFVR